ncbi:hypothetical protein GCM10010862_29360 [Devosia nitrariae]|uniref:Uncharacterized protein n=1 Tax=Devosia nitrariae TaxID=2071872 RepID=A0ABQ5W6S1_9HYPH|nr:hypothetical protein GCM10010862_29360 [Devosia nitrariae]
MKVQLELALLELVIGEQRLVEPPVRIRIAFHQVMRVVAMDEEKIDPHAARRLSVRGVQNMGRQATGTRHKLLP